MGIGGDGGFLTGEKCLLKANGMMVFPQVSDQNHWVPGPHPVMSLIIDERKCRGHSMETPISVELSQLPEARPLSNVFRRSGHWFSPASSLERPTYRCRVRLRAPYS